MKHFEIRNGMRVEVSTLRGVLMRNYLYWGAISFVLGAAVACSPVRFSRDESLQCQGTGSANCVVTPDGLETFGPFKFKVGGGKVDILFVDDNSASMSFEQSKLAERFSNFIQNLDARQVDYRIAITTTDIQTANNPPRAVNKEGALQNGRLVTFDDGSKFLTPSQANRVNLFNRAITRKETQDCESFIRNYIAQYGPASRNTTDYNNKYFQNCPSTDERGVYAPNLTILNNYDSFIRSDANLAVILISDEDARSELYAQQHPDFPLETLDTPASFASNMASKFPGKIWNFHSIIVKDASCRQQQSQQILDSAGQSVVQGSYGNLYAKFNLELKDEAGRPRGIMGDICASDYTSQLGQITTNISDRVEEIALKCKDPVSLSITPTSIQWSRNGNIVKLAQPLAVGTELTVTYKCNPKGVL